MLGVTVKVGLTCAIVWMVSCSFGVALAFASVPAGNESVYLLGLCAPLICSRSCLILSNSSWIQPLWCWASSNSLVACSYTFSAIRSTSSSVIVYSGGCLGALAFLHESPICILGLLDCVVSYGVAFKGVYCVVVSPLPCYLDAGEVSFVPSCASFFDTLPFFCCADI
jgi:hypothetical protein